MCMSGGVLFRKLGKETGKTKLWHLRFSRSGWRWTRRPATKAAAAAADGASSSSPTATRRQRRRQTLGALLLSFLRDALFRAVEAVEAVVLVAGMCFFFLRFGCRL